MDTPNSPNPLNASSPEAEMLNRYLNALRRSDEALGRLVKHLHDNHLEDSTLLVIEGDVETRAALRDAAAAFTAVPRLPAPAHRVITEPAQIAQRRVELSIPAKLPRVQMMFHTPQRGHADLYPLEVLQHVLETLRSGAGRRHDPRARCGRPATARSAKRAAPRSGR